MKNLLCCSSSYMCRPLGVGLQSMSSLEHSIYIQVALIVSFAMGAFYGDAAAVNAPFSHQSESSSAASTASQQYSHTTSQRSYSEDMHPFKCTLTFPLQFKMVCWDSGTLQPITTGSLCWVMSRRAPHHPFLPLSPCPNFSYQ